MRTEKEIYKLATKLINKESRIYSNPNYDLAFIKALFWVMEINTFGNIPFKYVLENHKKFKKLHESCLLDEEIEA